MNCGFFLILVLFHVSSFGQPEEFSTEIRESLKSKPRPWINLHNTFAFASGAPIQTRTVKVGLSFEKNVKLGIGYNWLATAYKYNVSGIDQFLKFHYVSGIAEYKFHRSGHWHFVIPVQLGLGSSYLESTIDESQTDKGIILLYEPTMIAEYHFLNYFSLAGGIGIRLGLINNSNIERQLTSPLFLIRFQIDLNKIVNELNESE